jgi:flagella basal body P-ring formation protein FlgA
VLHVRTDKLFSISFRNGSYVELFSFVCSQTPSDESKKEDITKEDILKEESIVVVVNDDANNDPDDCEDMEWLVAQEKRLEAAILNRITVRKCVICCSFLSYKNFPPILILL